jgi:hypothetical protein
MRGRGHTLARSFVPEKKTCSLAEAYGTEGGGYDGGSWSQVLLRLVDIVDALATSSDVLRVDRADSVSSRPDTEDKWVLAVSDLSGM